MPPKVEAAAFKTWLYEHNPLPNDKTNVAHTLDPIRADLVPANVSEKLNVVDNGADRLRERFVSTDLPTSQSQVVKLHADATASAEHLMCGLCKHLCVAATVINDAVSEIPSCAHLFCATCIQTHLQKLCFCPKFARLDSMRWTLLNQDGSFPRRASATASQLPRRHGGRASGG